MDGGQPPALEAPTQPGIPDDLAQTATEVKSMWESTKPLLTPRGYYLYPTDEVHIYNPMPSGLKTPPPAVFPYANLSGPTPIQRSFMMSVGCGFSSLH